MTQELMDAFKKSALTQRDHRWRWPMEPDPLPSMPDRPVLESRLPDGVLDSPAIRRAIVDYPDADEPRHAYAAWMLSQDHDLAQTIGAFVTAQLRVAEAFRTNPCADVMALRSWRGDRTFVSTPDFRAGDSLRPWFLDDLSSLISLGLIGWPQVYRGCVERVGVRARRFLEIADELFRLAPIRHLVLIGVPEVVDQLAASPHLARIRSLSLPRYSAADGLTDETLATLLASPHLGNLAHLRLVHQQNLTPLAYESVVTAATLPLLSNFEIYAPQIRWIHMDPGTYDPRSRSERMIAYDTPIAAMRSTEWTAELEQALGYVPCVHPEEHYGRGSVDIEAVIEHPIALDANIMARRGAPI